MWVKVNNKASKSQRELCEGNRSGRGTRNEERGTALEPVWKLKIRRAKWFLISDKAKLLIGFSSPAGKMERGAPARGSSSNSRRKKGPGSIFMGISESGPKGSSKIILKANRKANRTAAAATAAAAKGRRQLFDHTHHFWNCFQHQLARCGVCAESSPLLTPPPFFAFPSL